MEPTSLETALTQLGEYVASRGASYTVVVIGGAAINLLGFVNRVTGDVDVLAFGSLDGLTYPMEPWPTPLRDGIALVAEDMGLPADWMNAGPALQWRQGLPPGLEYRIQWRRFGGLEIGLVDRYDLIFFKLYAAADYVGRRSVHYTDLLALHPTSGELEAATQWVREQDPSEGFGLLLDQVLADVKRDSSE